MTSAINIIKDEHRSLGAVLHGLLYLVEEFEAGRLAPDFALLHAMLHYLQAYPERLHHPKEDSYLHPRMRERSQEGAALLDVLEAEHVRTRALTTDLLATLARYEETGSAGLVAFAQAVRAYADFHWAHMRREEDEVLPLALRTLLPEDWAEIDAAFAANQDPIVAGEVNQEFRQLFRKIVTLAPPPIGVGPEPPA